MSRQSARNESSNIYSHHFHDRAEDIAQRSLGGEIVVDTDAIGLRPEQFDIPSDHVLPNQAAQTSGRTGSAKGGHGHHGGVVGGSDAVTNAPARHEHLSQQDHAPTHHYASITESPEPQKR